jgi:hypothetical protein
MWDKEGDMAISSVNFLPVFMKESRQKARARFEHSN